jgi:Tfp pilus assembly protein FimV
MKEMLETMTEDLNTKKQSIDTDIIDIVKELKSRLDYAEQYAKEGMTDTAADTLHSVMQAAQQYSEIISKHLTEWRSQNDIVRILSKIN